MGGEAKRLRALSFLFSKNFRKRVELTMTKHYTLAKEEMAFYGNDCTSLQNILAVQLGPKADPAVTGKLAALGVKHLSTMSIEELKEFPGIGEIGAARIVSAFGLVTLAKKHCTKDFNIIRSPQDAADLFSDLQNLDQEHLDVAYLNTKNQVILRKNIFKGTLNGSIVHPREIMREGVRVGAASIVVSHNHPSQDPGASKEDIEVTKRLAEAGKIMGIELLDHIIIGGPGRYVSLKEKGYI